MLPRRPGETDSVIVELARVERARFLTQHQQTKANSKYGSNRDLLETIWTLALICDLLITYHTERTKTE